MFSSCFEFSLFAIFCCFPILRFIIFSRTFKRKFMLWLLFILCFLLFYPSSIYFFVLLILPFVNSLLFAILHFVPLPKIKQKKIIVAKEVYKLTHMPQKAAKSLTNQAESSWVFFYATLRAIFEQKAIKLYQKAAQKKKKSS